MSLVGKLAVTLNLTETVAADHANAVQALFKELGWTIVSGVAANQADKVWHDQRTLGASATEDLDLAGVLTGTFGVVTLAKLKALVIKAAAGNTNNVNVTQPASNGVAGLFLAASDGISIKPDGVFVWTFPGAGLTVTAGTGDLLTITNSAAGTGVTYDVYLVGTSA